MKTEHAQPPTPPEGYEIYTGTYAFKGMLKHPKSHGPHKWMPSRFSPREVINETWHEYIWYAIPIQSKPEEAISKMETTTHEQRRWEAFLTAMQGDWVSQEYSEKDRDAIFITRAYAYKRAADAAVKVYYGEGEK